MKKFNRSLLFLFISMIYAFTSFTNAQNDNAAGQFDFWVGEWNVQNQQGVTVGHSLIEKILRGNVIMENWKSVKGFEGKSFNYFDSTDNKWHQFWINDKAAVTTFVGRIENGNMVFYSRDHMKDTKPFLRKLIFYNLEKNKVRQFSQRTYDEGKTWHTEYDSRAVQRK